MTHAASRRFLALFFPFLPTDRLRAKSDVLLPDALVLTEPVRGSTRLAAVDRAAWKLGLRAGLALVDARARVPDLRAIAHDPPADAMLLARVASWCEHRTPMTSIDPPDGLTLDITGTAHLFDGELPLAASLASTLRKHGLGVLTAFADTPEAAHALARHARRNNRHIESEHLSDLPVGALRLRSEARVALRRAGLKTIGDLASRPTAPIAARLGEATTTQLARLLGTLDSRIVPVRPALPLRIERRFPEPILRSVMAMAVARSLIAEAAEVLEQRGEGGRRFVVCLERCDGTRQSVVIETSRPTRNPATIIRLFEERLTPDPLDPGFGFDAIILDIPVPEKADPLQSRLDGREVADGTISALADRLAIRFGPGMVRRLCPEESHWPERKTRVQSTNDPSRSWPAPEPGEPPTQPMLLFDPPQPIDVLAQVPDGPPRRFRWKRAVRAVVRAEGPERIAPEWWRSSEGVRDYYRVEDSNGCRLWLFRAGIYGETHVPRWFIHGLFA